MSKTKPTVESLLHDLCVTVQEFYGQPGDLAADYFAPVDKAWWLFKDAIVGYLKQEEEAHTEWARWQARQEEKRSAQLEALMKALDGMVIEGWTLGCEHGGWVALYNNTFPNHSIYATPGYETNADCGGVPGDYGTLKSADGLDIPIQINAVADYFSLASIRMDSITVEGYKRALRPVLKKLHALGSNHWNTLDQGGK